MKKLLLILSILLLLPLVIAPSPFTQSGSFDDGFELKAPIINSLKQAQDYEFEVHVYNKSNGIPIVSGIACYLHLYDNTGDHIAELKDATASHQFDYGFDVNGKNFSSTGIYEVVITCNNSIRGGFFNLEFEITPDGYSSDREIFILAVNILFILFLVYGCVTMILIIYRLFSLNADAVDVMTTMGGYFALMGFYWMINLYYPSTYMLSMTLLMLQIGGFTHLFLPILSLVLSLTIGELKKKS